MIISGKQAHGAILSRDAFNLTHFYTVGAWRVRSAPACFAGVTVPAPGSRHTRLLRHREAGCPLPTLSSPERGCLSSQTRGDRAASGGLAPGGSCHVSLWPQGHLLQGTLARRNHSSSKLLSVKPVWLNENAVTKPLSRVSVHVATKFKKHVHVPEGAWTCFEWPRAFVGFCWAPEKGFSWGEGRNDYS